MKILKILISLIIVLILYYFMLPPLNLTAPSFWSFVFTCGIVIYSLLIFFFCKDRLFSIINGRKVPKDKKIILVPLIGVSILLIIFIINFISSPLFNAKSYYERFC